jgi:simple sugar transport system ATP-binding protein
MSGITKFFGPVRANHDISLEVRAGEILGLLGENGAGKSTLMSVLFGLLRPDAGTIEIGGTPVQIRSPRDALANGIGMVHQHFMLIPALTVSETLILGDEPRRHGRVDHRVARAKAEALAERFGLRVDVDRKVGELSVGAQQRVEILRALYRDVRILILDEPTAVLTPQETESLFAVLRRMAADGMSVILISHKLHEVMGLANRITVIRDGEVVGSVQPHEVTVGGLATLMVGRQTELDLDIPPSELGEPLLELSQVAVRDSSVEGIDLTVRGGEIVGIVGIEGSGQEPLVAAVAGLAPLRSGSIRIAGHDATKLSVRRRLELGLAYVPEDRRSEGLVQDLSVRENAVMRRQWRRPFSSGGLLRPKAIRAHAAAVVEEADVRPRNLEAPVRALSGGNQQKLLLGREMADGPDVIVVSQPTRGVDIAASQAIHERLLAQRAQAKAILLSSLDLDEVKALSDRIVVMAGGRIVGELARGAYDNETLGLLMAGQAELAGKVEAVA